MSRPRLHAYILAADPTWLEYSVSRYYSLVDKIIVSYDRSERGWSGSPVAVAESLKEFARIDVDRKGVYVPGDFSDPTRSPIEHDTAQRQEALRLAGDGAQWVLQIDTDEILPKPHELIERLAIAEEVGAEAVEWPMRVLYRRRRRDFLEVVDWDASSRFDYPGPIAVRPSARLVDARRTDGPYLRCVVRGDSRSLQLQRTTAPGEKRLEDLDADAAILHNSWARSPRSVRQKVKSWGHNAGWRSTFYYWSKWYCSPLTWRLMRDFHPFSGGLWPRLAPTRDPNEVIESHTCP